MKPPIIIGRRTFKTKKAAKEHYSSILNAYQFGDSLSDEHYHEVFDLIQYYFSMKESHTTERNTYSEAEATVPKNVADNPVIIQDIRVAKFQFNNKCFEVVPSIREPLIISYRHFIDLPKTSKRSVFNKVCRNTIQADLIRVKQAYFKDKAIGGKAPCQETKILLEYENLVVDHRQPNTFSVIVDRFIELKNINLDTVNYEVLPTSLTQFSDRKLADLFREYHKEKALLRVVDKSLNMSRSGLSRLKPLKDDLKIIE